MQTKVGLFGTVTIKIFIFYFFRFSRVFFKNFEFPDFPSKNPGEMTPHAAGGKPRFSGCAMEPHEKDPIQPSRDQTWFFPTETQSSDQQQVQCDNHKNYLHVENCSGILHARPCLQSRTTRSPRIFDFFRHTLERLKLILTANSHCADNEAFS